MAFNKAKTVEAAQKHLAAGKIPQAIAEYQQVLRVEPDDQVTLMTVGDLYVRVGDNKQAMVYFEKLAQIFNSDGFISKSIAIYKKIQKFAPDEVLPLERLAELYVQQGVMSEARPIFLQLAESHLKANRTQPAIEVLRKLLDLAPDNLRVQQRLADLYMAIGQEKEASGAFISTAQRLIEKGDAAEALKMAEKAIHAAPKNSAAVAIKARALAAGNRQKEAIDLLVKLPPSMTGPETSSLLTELYMQTGRSEEALKLARSAFSEGPARFPLVFGVINGLLEGGETDRGLALLGEIRSGVLQAGESERLISALQSAMDRLPGQLEPIEWLADAYRATGDPFHLPEALGQLADAAVFAGKLDKAKSAVEELVEKDPENEAHKQRLRDICGRMGAAAPTGGAPAEDMASFQVDVHAPVETAPEPVQDVPLDEETERFIQQALTDVDLFTSYGLTQKGVDLLESVLKRAPGHPATLERLLDLHLGAGNEKRTSEIAGQLEEYYTGKGDAANADKFAELRRRFQRAAARTDEAAASASAAEFAVPFEVTPSAPAPTSPPPPAAAKEETHEVDLSAEWAMMTEQAAASDTAAAAAPPVKPTAPEPEAPTGFEDIPFEVEVPLETSPAPAEVIPVPDEPAAPPPAAEEAISYDFSVDVVSEEEAAKPVEVAPVEIIPEAILPEAEAAELFGSVAAEIMPEPPAPPPPKAAPPKPAPPPRPAPPPPPAPEETITVDYDFAAPSAASPVEKAPAPAAPMSSSQFLSELGDELADFEITKPEKKPEPPKPPPPKKKEEPKAAKPAGPKDHKTDHLREVFDEFRADMGEAIENEEEGEDLETHYNLGIAYREMGLAEEAIGEFQKVAKSAQSGRAFKYAMQCYTLLGLTFMEKGQPKISAIWYEKALKTPDLDPESVMAIRYDLGIAQEQAGEYKAAMESFSQVYAMNIDYRDVGERISELQKKV